MAQKHLHELLREDQEPFLLKNYIDERRTQLQEFSPKNQLQVKKLRKPISETSIFHTNFCKNACFFSFNDSPDLRKSPLFDFAPSPAKSPCKSPKNAVCLHIPARTTAMLLEAAIRIEKQQSCSKSKTQSKSHGFGLFGSMLKKLTNINRNKKREIAGDGDKVSSIGRRKSFNGSEKMQKNSEEKSSCETGFSCSFNGRPSSAVWSESNEEKSLDFDSLSTSSQSDSEEIVFVSQEKEDDLDFENRFCESPFRFVLQTSPSPGRRTPEFSSPAASPSRLNKKENGDSKEGMPNKFQVQEEEKQQCSPVSVLDPPFEDVYTEGHNEKDEKEKEKEKEKDEDEYDLECSYAIVQRAKHNLLHKLRRFERLAELDPIELERRMLDADQDEDESDTEEEEERKDSESRSSNREKEVNDFVKEFYSFQSIPRDMKRLLSDLIAEEESCQSDFEDREFVVKRVCKRLESWKEVESNTIDMMVEHDFRKQLDVWRKNEEQVGETAFEVELAIFGLLLEELSEDLVCLNGH